VMPCPTIPDRQSDPLSAIAALRGLGGSVQIGS
jgi:hypothetical protein